MGSLLGDFRYAARSLVRQPTFAAMAILTLVLGIGTNTAIFSVIKAVLLNKLPYQDPSRLVVLWEQNPDGNTDLVAPLTYLDWKEQAKSIQSMTAFRQLRYAFAGAGQPLDVASVRATANLFSTLRVERAASGRTFLPEESTPGQDRVAVLSRAFWERHFGGAQDAIGRTIQLDACRTRLSASCRQNSISRPAATSMSGRRSASTRTTRTDDRERPGRSTSSLASPTAPHRPRRSRR